MVGCKIDYKNPESYVNLDEKEGLPLFLVKLWSGSGYILTYLLVFAEDIYDAIDKAFAYSEENQWDVTMSEQEAYEYAKIGADDDDDIYELMNEQLVSNSDCTIYARWENFFVDKVPDDIEHL